MLECYMVESSRWSPLFPTSWYYSYPCIVISHIVPGLACRTTEYSRNGDMLLSKLGYKRLWLLSWFSLHLITPSLTQGGQLPCPVAACGETSLVWN